MTYRLTRRCELDIIDIHLRGTRLFGLPHADRYQAGLQATFGFLAAYPHVARERKISRHRVRLHPYRAHLIVYRVFDDGILVIRVLHSRQDWARHLRSG